MRSSPINLIERRAIERRIHRFAAMGATLFFYTFYCIPVAYAGDFSDYGSAHTAFRTFLVAVGDYMDLVLAPGSNAAAFLDAFAFTAMFYKIVVVMGRYIFLAGNMVDIAQAVVLIAIVSIILGNYDWITNLLLSWSGDFASAIQVPITGSPDVFFVVDYLQKLWSAVGTEDTSLFTNAKLVFAIWALYGLLTILSVLAFFAVAWAVWGFALAKLIGWMFIPFLLFERTAFLFDGWLRFLIGFLLYAVIARVNLVLVMLLFTIYFGLDPADLTAPVDAIIIENPDQIGGLMSLIIISLLSLVSTGRFATALAGGVGGFGSAVGTIARTAALGLRAGSIAAAGRR